MKWISRLLLFLITLVLLLAWLSYVLEKNAVPGWLQPFLPENLTAGMVVDALMYVLLSFSVLPVALYFFIQSSVLDWNAMEDLEKSGMPVKVRVLQHSGGGIQINDMPIVDFELEVHPEGKSPFTVKTKQLVQLTELSRIENGVWYDGYAHKTRSNRVMVLF
jgi:hypothetical protein